jgi:hypothetical protein
LSSSFDHGFAITGHPLKKAVLFVLCRLLYSNQIDLSAIFAKENKKVIKQQGKGLGLGVFSIDGF